MEVPASEALKSEVERGLPGLLHHWPQLQTPCVVDTGDRAHTLCEVREAGAKHGVPRYLCVTHGRTHDCAPDTCQHLHQGACVISRNVAHVFRGLESAYIAEDAVGSYTSPARRPRRAAVAVRQCADKMTRIVLEVCDRRYTHRAQALAVAQHVLHPFLERTVSSQQPLPMQTLVSSTVALLQLVKTADLYAGGQLVTLAREFDGLVLPARRVLSIRIGGTHYTWTGRTINGVCKRLWAEYRAWCERSPAHMARARLQLPPAVAGDAHR